MDDIVNAIAYEVKQEIANRYFGFRSQIETEIGEYLERLDRTDRDQLAEVRQNVLRMQILLHREEFLKDFLLTVKLPEDLADNRKLRTSPAAAQPFSGMRGVGFSRWRRYRDLAFQVYRSLEESVAAYRKAYLLLSDQYTEICTRIDDFHRNNDLSGILLFLRTFDSSESERLKFLHSENSPHPGKDLDEDLRIAHPRPVTAVLPDLPALPPVKQIKNSLHTLLKAAYGSLDGPDTPLPL